MSWFKVDDSFHSHPKVYATSPAALGLWVVAASWSSANLTDGFVPDHALPRLLPNSTELANELVTAGLWRRSKGGFRFHDWADYNLASEEVRAAREAARERMRVLRQRRRANSETPAQASDCSGEQSRTTDERSGGVRNPDPTRPEPSKEGSLDAGKPRPPKKAAATYIPDDFTVTDHMAKWARKNCPDVDGRYETAQFVDYWAGEDAKKRDWTRTWYRWMRKAQKDITEKGARLGDANVRHLSSTDERCARHPRQLAGHCALCAADAKGRAA